MQPLPELAEVLAHERLDVCVQDGRRGALELAPLRRHLVRRGDRERGMTLPDAFRRQPLVPWVEVCVEEADRDRLDSLGHEQVDLAVERVEVERHEHRPVACEPLRHFAPEIPRDERCRRPVEDVVQLGPRAAAEREDVAEAGRGDEADPCTALLKDGVDTDGRAVEEEVELRQPDRQSLQPGEELVHERLAPGRLLLDYELTGLLVEEDEVDERATDVDRTTVHQASLNACG